MQCDFEFKMVFKIPIAFSERWHLGREMRYRHIDSLDTVLLIP